jgi:hypothetical protein
MGPHEFGDALAQFGQSGNIEQAHGELRFQT